MCRIDYADDDGGQWVVSPGPRRAAKDHRCDDCGRSITKGESYLYGKWLMPGEGFTSVKLCPQCKAAGRWLKVVCGGHLWPGVMEELEEHWDEEFDLRSRGLQWLVMAGREKWQRRGQLVPVEMVSAWVDKALAKVPETARH